MKILNGRVAVAAYAVTLCASTCLAQYQNASSAGAASSGVMSRGTASSSAMSAASALTGVAGQGSVDSSGSGSARATYDGASRWTAGGSSFTETDSGAWAGSKGTFGGSRGASWEAGSKSFGEHVQLGGIWRVDPSISPAGAPEFPATSIPAAGAVAQGNKPSETGKAAQAGLQPQFSALPTGMTKGAPREHAYGHSAARLSSALPHRPSNVGGQRGHTLAARSGAHRSAGFGRSSGAAGRGAGRSLTGVPNNSKLATPNLTDPGLSDPLQNGSGLNGSGLQDPLGSGMPQ